MVAFPRMQQQGGGRGVGSLQIVTPPGFGPSRLVNQGFPKRVMAFNEKLVAVMKAFKVALKVALAMESNKFYVA